MNRCLLLVSVLLLLVLAAPVFAQNGEDCTNCTPFDQAAELDAACPNGNCTNFYGGNFDSCMVFQSTSPSAGCYSCGQVPGTEKPSCLKVTRDAACGCKMTTQNYITTCGEKGSCRYFFF